MWDNSLEQPLAGFRRRATAHLIDIGLFFLPLAVFVFLYIVMAASSLGDCVDDVGVGPCDRRVPGIIMVLVLALVFLAFSWWLIALQWGQTPGKVLLRIQVIKKNGGASGRGYTFIRDVASKGFPSSLAWF